MIYDTIPKTLLAWAFNRYIAYYYFDNVNVNQLKVAFEDGQIELENLPIKKDALRHLNLPWNVVTGSVGKLCIKIPLLSLFTDPWLIRLDNLTLTVSPNKQQQIDDDESSGNQSSLDAHHDANETSLVEYLDNSILDDSITPEETKLAEFYSSFSATVSAAIKDIFKNIKLEVDNITLLFEGFTHGLVKFDASSLLFHRPDSDRNVAMKDASFYFNSIGSYTWHKQDELLRASLYSCNLVVCDMSQSSNNMSLKINSETNIKGNLFFVESSGSSSIPLCEFLLEDPSILYFSTEQQQDGSLFGRITCCHFNREMSTWDSFLDPWPFYLSWNKRPQHKKISLTSDEFAEFTLSSALFDLFDVVIRRVLTTSVKAKLWQSVINSAMSSQEKTRQELNSILLLCNETGHKLFYAPVDEDSELIASHDRSKTFSPIMNVNGDTQSLIHKLSLSSKSSTDNDKDSSDFQRTTHWKSIDASGMGSIETTKSLLIRVDGWKTLPPIRIDRTGDFFLKARSDRVKNEDTHIAITINLEENSARKFISIKSPLTIVNLLDTTLEIHFCDADHAIYIQPEGQVAVPLPYLYDRVHIRPCSVGVTMSEEPLIWDDILQIPTFESKVHICYPITMTDKKHASYCTSKAYRICASIRREQPTDTESGELLNSDAPDAFAITFMPPLIIVNMLPCEMKYFVGEICGALPKGSQQHIYHVDTTKPTSLYFEMNGFPKSKPINIDPGATGSFQFTLEMIDKNNRSLYLRAKIVLVSLGEEPAVKVVIYAPFWLINKTRLPLIFKQEGAAIEAAGQYRDHEERPFQTLLFSFYDTELEPPWLCSLRVGKSKGISMWCDGFKLEKGSGQRKLCFTPRILDGEPKMNRSIIDISIRRGLGEFCDSMIVVLTTRYGFDCIAKTPKKAFESSPHDYKLAHYNYNTNLAHQIGGRSARQLFVRHCDENESEMSFMASGMKMRLVDNARERIAEILLDRVAITSITKAKEQIVDCSIQDIKIENAMLDCEKDLILDRAPESDLQSPAIRMIVDRIIGRSFGTIWFRQVQLSMCEFLLNIEEKVFLKLVQLINYNHNRRKKNTDNLLHDLDRIIHPEEDRLSKYYFDLLRIDLSSLRLSVFTSNDLPATLQRFKSRIGLKFFGFEDARIQLSPYFKMNVSRTLKSIFDSVTRFYKRQISEQAPRIVGQQIQNYLRFHLSDFLSSLYDEVYNKLFY